MLSRFALLLALAICSFACGSPGTAYRTTRSGASVDVAISCRLRADVVEVDVEPSERAVESVWMTSGLALRAEPLELARGASAWHARFARAGLGAGPWTAHVVAAGEEIAVPLGRCERRPLDACRALFGYRRERWTLPDGTRSTVYARTARSGEDLIVAADVFERSIGLSLDRTCATLPEGTMQSLRACPELADFVAGIFESGAAYEGATEGRNRHPHARGFRFWSPPRERARGQADPIDSLVWFLIEGLNASSADSYREIWSGVLDGSLSEDRYLRREARQKAEHLIRVVDLAREHGECLRLEELLPDFGAVFQEYERWVWRARRSPAVLAEIILSHPGTYVDNPAESALTYRMRLRALYRANAPGPKGERRVGS